MEIAYGAGLGLQNRFEALFLDNSTDPLEAIRKTDKKTSKKLKPRKDPAAKTKTKLETKLEQTKSRNPQAESKKSGKAKKSQNVTGILTVSSNKSATKPAKPSAAVPEKPIEVPFKRMLTLDEYREKQTIRNTPLYNLRQPGEGEDLSQWENLVPLKKKEFEAKGEEVVHEASELPQRASRVRHMPVRCTFGDSLVQQATTRRDLEAARLAADAAAAAKHAKRQRPPKLNELEFPTLG